MVNCTVSSNSAANGGGTWASLLTNSLLTGNSSSYGGGSLEDVLVSCRLVGNSAPGWGGGGAAGSKLIGCTLTGNSSIGGSYGYGGGAIASVLNDCYLANNIAQVGGGASGSPSQSFPCILTNCVLIDNSAVAGGGAALSILINCTLVRNSAQDRTGGAYRCSDTNGFVNNSVIYYNTAPLEPNHSASTLNHTCTTPDPGSVGNVLGDPLFLNLAGGNLRLQSNSPCINTGNNAFVADGTDLDGRPRIGGGTVDMGAYEFQGSQPVLNVAKSAGGAVLSWPQWASDFLIQQIGATPMTSAGWSNLVADPIIINNENSVSVPLEGTQRLFRLFKP